MSTPKKRMLTEVFAETGDLNVAAICPTCGTVGAAFQAFHVNTLPTGTKVARRPAFDIHLGRCSLCAELAIGIGRPGYTRAGAKNEALLLFPADQSPDLAPNGLEAEIRASYDEARAILSRSPMGAAVLARRCLQHVIRSKLGISKRTLFQEIQEAVKSDELTKPTRERLDHVREIGNWSAHPSEDANQADTLIEVTPEEARYSIEVLELLFHDLYEVPARTQAMTDRLKAKGGGNS